MDIAAHDEVVSVRIAAIILVIVGKSGVGMSASVSISLTGQFSRESEFDVAYGSAVKIAIPSDYSAEMNGIAQKDLEIIADILRQHPETVQELMRGASQGRLSEARAAAAKMGITEARFIRDGGGVWAVVVVIAVAAALLLASDSPAPPPEPTTGGANAGTG